jgi:hypothetical protein
MMTSAEKQKGPACGRPLRITLVVESEVGQVTRQRREHGLARSVFTQRQ